MKLILSSLIALVSVLGSFCSAEAQPASRPPHKVAVVDSSKVYTYVERMPVYPGGLAALSADLRREFQVASAAAGCATPASRVFVRLVVGPSGFVYAAHSINSAAINMPPSPSLPPACEAAIGTAAHRLPRLQPGRQNGRAVAVELMVKLLDGNK
jgi:protein TonB